MIFYLGTHLPEWLSDPRFADIPLFLARQRFTDRRTGKMRKRLPRAVGSWAGDSGSFTQLQQHGHWTITPAEYVAEVRRLRDEVGGLLWAAPQDWMCEPWVITGGKPRGSHVTFAGTHLSVAEHIRRTVENYLELRSLDPALPFIPVLQGWTLGDYLDCAELYERAGVHLRDEPLVGVGTMCRRQDTIRAGMILHHLADDGLRIHGFGLKTEGIRLHGASLASADSLAWSEHATHHPPLDGHDRPGLGRRKGHKHCNNCPDFALEWRERVVAGLRRVAPEACATLAA